MALAPASRARLQATLACVGAWTLFASRGGPGFSVAVAITTTLAVLAWFIPRSYLPVQRGLDRVIHWTLVALTWLLLGLLYLLIFTPLRLWHALIGRDLLKREVDAKAASYLQPIPPAAVNRFDRQF